MKKIEIQVDLDQKPVSEIVDIGYQVIENEKGGLYAISGLWHVVSVNPHRPCRVMISPTDKGQYELLGVFNNKWFTHGGYSAFKQKGRG
ncbi:hypothetical protein KAR91_70095 [Candidatus Pacearchaeota archaeon]|nr:hypothetical protein [Candidatus Pacearchaeota archaeon]